MSNQPAPVALFVFARPEHTRRTLEALKNNHLSDQTDLIVFADGPQSDDDVEKVNAVREIVKSTTGFRSVNIIERECNYYIARNINDGVTEVCGSYERVIVLEDDLVTSPWFLTFMNEALDFYQDEETVASIEGYIYPVKTGLPETFFLRGAGGWGWATWNRAWKLYIPDAKFMLSELKSRNLTGIFDFNGAAENTRLLEAQARGEDDNWDILWHASMFIANMLTLHPGRSLVQNIGHDGTGVHSSRTDFFNTELSETKIRVGSIPVEDSTIARAAFEETMKNRESLSFKVRKTVYRAPDLIFRSVTTRSSSAAAGLKRRIKRLAPLVLLDLIRDLRVRSTIHIEGPYSSWDDAKSRTTGYDQGNILKKVRAAALQVKNGLAEHERDSVLFDSIEYSWPVLSALMLVAARNGGRLRVLDFGGSLGSSFFQYRKFLQHIPDVKWGVVEQPHFVECGRHEIEGGGLVFFDSIEQCAHVITPNVALLSGVLQVLDSPFDILGTIKDTVPAIIIDRTPFIQGRIDLACVQHVPESVYCASYPVWLFSESKFMESIGDGWEKLEEFDALDDLPSPVDTIWKGMILVRKIDSKQ